MARVQNAKTTFAKSAKEITLFAIYAKTNQERTDKYASNAKIKIVETV